MSRDITELVPLNASLYIVTTLTRIIAGVPDSNSPDYTQCNRKFHQYIDIHRYRKSIAHSDTLSQDSHSCFSSYSLPHYIQMIVSLKNRYLPAESRSGISYYNQQSWNRPLRIPIISNNVCVKVFQRTNLWI